MRRLEDCGNLRDLSSEALSVMQFYTIKEPLFPNLETLELSDATGQFLPFIHLFLSPRTTTINITFDEYDSSEPIIASMITAFPTLCPSLEVICLRSLPSDPMITAAVSGMLLASNRNALKGIDVDSPLTEEAREVIYKLPNLRGLSMIIESDTSLPPVVLPSLTILVIRYDHGSEWLRTFHGVTFENLELVAFYSAFGPVGDFLEAFEKVALAASAQNTLSEFSFYTSHSWRPNYRSLLPFTRLEELIIDFPCERGCSSTIDDDIVTDMARAMPRLKILYLGAAPCKTPIGVTAKGLATLAHHCRHLSELCIHFQLASLEIDMTTITGVTSSSEPTIPRKDCALTGLDVGKIPVPEESTAVVALSLLHIFPCIKHIKYSDLGWREVVNIINLSKQPAADHSSKEPLLAPSRSQVDDVSPRDHT